MEIRPPGPGGGATAPLAAIPGLPGAQETSTQGLESLMIDGSGWDGCLAAMGSRSGETGGNGPATGVITKVKPRTKKPAMYKVVLLNDDYTPMEFVVVVLERFFGKSQEEATQIMLHVHRRGIGICGVYPYEIAETKVTQVIDFARKNEHPLQCMLEKD